MWNLLNLAAVVTTWGTKEACSLSQSLVQVRNELLNEKLLGTFTIALYPFITDFHLMNFHATIMDETKTYNQTFSNFPTAARAVLSPVFGLFELRAAPCVLAVQGARSTRKLFLLENTAKIVYIY